MYVIQLSNNKWFIYFSESFLEAAIFTECKALYEFVRENEPIRIQKTKMVNSLLKVDYFVKKYMMKYGIDNVRGGTYSNIHLSDHLYHSLVSELSSPSQNVTMMDVVKRTNEKYINFIWSNENIQPEIERLTHELAIYSEIENTLFRLQYHKVQNVMSKKSEYVFFDNAIFTELEWLRVTIDEIRSQNQRRKTDLLFEKLTCAIQNAELNELRPIDTTELELRSDLQWISDWMKEENISQKKADQIALSNTKKKYWGIMYRFSGLYDTFNYIQERFYDYPLTYTPLLHLQRPDTCLDAIFCHSNASECHYEPAAELLTQLEYMANVVENRIHETQFTLNQYPPTFRAEIEYSIRYLRINASAH